MTKFNKPTREEIIGWLREMIKRGGWVNGDEEWLELATEELENDI